MRIAALLSQRIIDQAKGINKTHSQMAEFVRAREKHKIEAVLQEFGFTVSDFIESESDRVYKLELPDSGLWVEFVMDSNHWDHFIIQGSKWTPGKRQTFSIQSKSGGHKHLVDCLADFRRWIQDNVVLCLEDKDLNAKWSTRRKEQQGSSYFNVSPFTNKVFTPAQQNAIEERLFAFKIELKKSIPLDEEQLKKVEDSVTYLVQESKKQSIFAWVGIALAVIGFLPTDLNLKPEFIETLRFLFFKTLETVRALRN